MLTLILAAMAMQPSDDAACTRFGDAAEAIMRERQNERPIGEVLAGLKRDPNWLYLMLRDMTLEAYGKEAYYSDEAQQREIKRFRNIWERACLANMANPRSALSHNPTSAPASLSHWTR